MEERSKQTNIENIRLMNEDGHFNKIFWFIVGLTSFGAFLSVFIISIYPKELSSRFADTVLIFWLSTAVSGGIGYLIGSSAMQRNKVPPSAPGKVTADVSATITSDTTEESK